MCTVEESLRYLHDKDATIIVEIERFVTFWFLGENIYYDMYFNTLETETTSTSLELIYYSSNIMFNIGGETCEESCRKLIEVCEAMFPGWVKVKKEIDVSFDEFDLSDN